MVPFSEFPFASADKRGRKEGRGWECFGIGRECFSKEKERLKFAADAGAVAKKVLLALLELGIRARRRSAARKMNGDADDDADGGTGVVVGPLGSEGSEDKKG